MSNPVLTTILLGLISFGYIYGKKFAFAAGSKMGGVQNLHSRPTYHGMLIAFWCALPSVLILLVWQFVEPAIISSMVLSSLPDSISSLAPEHLGLVMNDIKNLSMGLSFGAQIDPDLLKASDYFIELQQTGINIKSGAIIVLSLTMLLVGFKLLSPSLRARNYVERIIRYFLICCSTIASRRFIRTWCHKIRNCKNRGYSSCPARHCRRYSPRCFKSHWRNHDCCDGRRSFSKSYG